MVKDTTRPFYVRESDPVPVLQEAGWDQGPVHLIGSTCSYRRRTGALYLMLLYTKRHSVDGKVNEM